MKEGCESLRDARIEIIQNMESAPATTELKLDNKSSTLSGSSSPQKTLSACQDMRPMSSTDTGSPVRSSSTYTVSSVGSKNIGSDTSNPSSPEDHDVYVLNIFYVHIV